MLYQKEEPVQGLVKAAAAGAALWLLRSGQQQRAPRVEAGESEYFKRRWMRLCEALRNFYRTQGASERDAEVRVEWSSAMLRASLTEATRDGPKNPLRGADALDRATIIAGLSAVSGARVTGISPISYAGPKQGWLADQVHAVGLEWELGQRYEAVCSRLPESEFDVLGDLEDCLFADIMQFFYSDGNERGGWFDGDGVIGLSYMMNAMVYLVGIMVAHTALGEDEQAKRYAKLIAATVHAYPLCPDPRNGGHYAVLVA